MAEEYTRAGLIERAETLEADAVLHRKNDRDNAALHCEREAGDLRAVAADLPEDAVIVTDKDRIADLEVECASLRVENDGLVAENEDLRGQLREAKRGGWTEVDPEALRAALIADRAQYEELVTGSSDEIANEGAVADGSVQEGGAEVPQVAEETNPGPAEPETIPAVTGEGEGASADSPDPDEDAFGTPV